MNILIKGAGITGMILCDVLSEKHPDWNIKVMGVLTEPKDYPLFLDVSQIDFEPSAFKSLTKKCVKVGYTKNNLRTIVDKPTKEMLEMYYKKQNRQKTSSSMSNSKTEYYAYDLRDWYKQAVRKWSNLISKNVTGEFDLIFETKTEFDLLTENKVSFEYITMKDNNLKGYDYVYDCSDSNIKRYNRNCNELVKYAPDAIKISNYYNKPQIVTQYDVASKCETIYISRNATKSQLKIVDALNYVHNRWGEKYEN